LASLDVANMTVGQPGLQGCIQKFPDWLFGVRTANDTAVCH